MKRLACWLVAWYMAVGVSAQFDVQFRNVNVSHGMPNNLSWCVQSLDDHTLLVVCDYAFAIYDGAEFHKFAYDFSRRYRVSTFSNSTSYVDGKRRVWIKNYVNLFLYDQRRGRFDYSLDSLFRSVGVKEHVVDFFIDNDKDAWLLTEKGRLYLTDFNSPARMVYAKRSGNTHIVNVAQAGSECLLLHSDGSVTFYDKRRQSIDRTERMFGGNDPYSEYSWTAWGSHQVVIGTKRERNGLWLYDCNTKQWKQIDSHAYGYTRLLRTADGELVAVHPWGMVLFDNHLRPVNDISTFKTEENSYTNRDLLDATIDWQGGLWLSSYRYGLFYTHKLLPRLSTLPISALSFDNLFMVSDSHGNVYATQDGTIWSINGNDKTAIHSGQATSFSLLGTSGNGQLLVRSPHSLFYIRNGKSTDISDIVPELPKAMTALPDGRIFICMISGKAGWIDLAKRIFTPCPIPNDFIERYRDVRFLRYDEQGRRIIFGGKFGVFFYDIPKRSYSHFFPNGNDFNGYTLCCNDYLRDSRGNQLFATNVGLFIQPRGKNNMLRLTAKDGLLDDCVHAVVEDPQGRIWAMSSTGLTSLSAQKGINNITYQRHRLKYLVNGGEFADRCLAFAQNSLWCGSTNGIVRMSPADEEDKQEPLQVFLSASHTPDAARTITIPYNSTSLSLTFSACDYLHNGENTYRYWINDDEPRQVTAANLHLEYSRLTPGRYKLNIQVKTADGDWSEPAVWTIHVLAPWWRTWWAYLIYIFIAGTLIVAARYVWSRWTWLQSQLKERRNKFLVQASEVKPTDIQITPREQQFLQKAVTAVETHIADSDYGVEQLSADMALTRTGLYRRLQAICGQSPIDFIRTIRLRRGEQLLRKSGLSIDEISQRIGFKSSRTFCSSFKQIYGQTPSDYRKKGE